MDKQKESKRIYYLKNRERLQEYKKNYNIQNKMKIYNYNRKYLQQKDRYPVEPTDGFKISFD